MKKVFKTDAQSYARSYARSRKSGYYKTYILPIVWAVRSVSDTSNGAQAHSYSFGQADLLTLLDMLFYA